MQISANQTDNIDVLEEAWEKAAELAMKFVPDRARAVVSAVCDRLAGVNRHDAVRASMRCACGSRDAGCRSAARRRSGARGRECVHCCGQLEEGGASVASVGMMSRVAGAHVGPGALARGGSLCRAEVHQHSEAGPHARGCGAAGVGRCGLGAGDVRRARRLGPVPQAGRATRAGGAHQVCGPLRRQPRATAYAHALAGSPPLIVWTGQPDQALAVFAKHGAPCVPQNFNLYKRIATDLYSSPATQPYSLLAQLRDMLSSVVR